MRQKRFPGKMNGDAFPSETTEQDIGLAKRERNGQEDEPPVPVVVGMPGRTQT
jgi:hypothetical protein